MAGGSLGAKGGRARRGNTGRVVERCSWALVVCRLPLGACSVGSRAECPGLPWELAGVQAACGRSARDARIGRRGGGCPWWGMPGVGRASDAPALPWGVAAVAYACGVRHHE